MSARRVAELIQRGQADARGLLGALVEKGLIEPRGAGMLRLVGERRTARYVAAAAQSDGTADGDPVDALLGSLDAEPSDELDVVIHGADMGS